MKRVSIPVALIMAALLTNCWFPGVESGESDDPMRDMLLAVVALPSVMEINGSWQDNFGSNHTIQGSKANSLDSGTGTWRTDTTERTILEYSNESKTAYTRTGVPSWCSGQGASFPNCTCFDAGECFSRFTWTNAQDKFYFCEVVYNKPTLADAKSDNTAANSSDPTNTGCGGFSWTRLDAK